MRTEPQGTTPPNRVLAATGACSAILGSAVILGWYLHVMLLVRLSPALAPMAFNAAVGFLLCGLGLLSCAYGRDLMAKVFACTAAVLPVLTAIEFVSDVDLHIDQIFARVYFQYDNPHLGRMAPNAAGGLILISLAVAACSSARIRRRPVVIGLLGSAIAALGVAPLVGYVIGIKTAFGWGNLGRMALHASCGLAVIGVGLVAFAWQRGKQAETGAPRWVPVLVALASTAVTVILSQALIVQERHHVDKLVRNEANDVLQDCTEQLDIRMRALDRLGKQWEDRASSSRGDWQRDASLPYDYLLVTAAVWIDPSMRIQWVVSDGEQNRNFEGLDLSTTAVRYALERARGSRILRATALFDTPAGPTFLAVRSIFPRGQFNGFVGAVFTAHQLFPRLIGQHLDRPYAFKLFEDGALIFAHEPAYKPDVPARASATAELRGTEWRVDVWPGPEMRGEATTWLPPLFLGVGLLLTALLTISAYLFQTSQARGYHLSAANELLQRQSETLAAANEALERQSRQLSAANEELERRGQELVRSNQELQQFAYVASHDLQEPLRMVASYTELLRKRYKDKLDTDANEFIDFAVEGATRMQSLINDLLAYSRVGTRAKELQPVDMNGVLATAMDNLRVAIVEQCAKIESAQLPQVIGDNVQLVQLLQNLLSNAIKFRGTGQPCVRLSVRRQGSDWLFSVSDNGIGIEAADRDRVFVIFQRLHTREEYPGTGIGLAVCKKIVERHGGRIWVESQPGKGSTFFFTMPIEREALSRAA